MAGKAQIVAPPPREVYTLPTTLGGDGEIFVVPFNSGRLVSAYAKYNTSSSAATQRTSKMEHRYKGKQVVGEFPGIGIQQANWTFTYVFTMSANAHQSASGFTTVLPLPDQGLRVGLFDTLQLISDNPDSADSWTDSLLMFEIDVP